MNDLVESFEYKGHTINIRYDFDPWNPREWDNLGTIVAWHRRYNLGDDTPAKGDKLTHQQFLLDLAGNYEDQACGWNFDDLWEWARYDNIGSVTDGACVLEKVWEYIDKLYIILPVYMYEHGGVALSTGSFHDPWDSGQVGYIYVSKERVRNEYGWKKLTQKRIAKIKSYLEGEIETYSQYLNGEVYGYEVEFEDGDTDSCWGYYEYDYCVQEAKSIVDHVVKKQDEKAWLRLQAEEV